MAQSRKLLKKEKSGEEKKITKEGERVR